MFTVQHRDPGSAARTGLLSLGHGDVRTPAFMPVGTNGAVKAMPHTMLEDIGFNLILGNTYHLYLRPGMDVIRQAGGLHRFTNWNHNILSDSGGYQVFSLAPFRKLTEEGVRFRSHIDGSAHFITPEDAVDIQAELGSDVRMCLDVCTPPEISYNEALKASNTTTAWALRSWERWKKKKSVLPGTLFGIIQGNFFKELRKRSADELIEIGFPGYAIGGLSVGEPFTLFCEILRVTAPLLPEDKPRYLMGIGTPEYILEAVEMGMDLFDCVFPTRIARNGTVFTSRGTIALKWEKHRLDFTPIEEGCRCYTCSRYSKAYLRHLFKAKEILGPILTSYHNLYFLFRLVRDIQEAVSSGTFAAFKKQFLTSYDGIEE